MLNYSQRGIHSLCTEKKRSQKNNVFKKVRIKMGNQDAVNIFKHILITQLLIRKHLMICLMYITQII